MVVRIMNGNIFTERKWKDGKLVEIIICVDRKGNDLDKGTYKNGLGTVHIYDVNGKLLETSYFEKGEFKN